MDPRDLGPEDARPARFTEARNFERLQRLSDLVLAAATD
jgi:hypothetical protein